MSTKKKKEARSAVDPLIRVDREELKRIAIGLVTNQVFTHFHIEERDRDRMVPSVFLPLLFLSDQQRQEMLRKNPHVFYEFLSNAGPRSINGYPIFHSVRTLVKEDWEIVVELAKNFEEAAKKL